MRLNILRERAPGLLAQRSEAVRFFFEDHVLDPDRRELWRGSTQVALEPQVFDLLLCLLRNRDRVVSKDDLIAEVWGGRVVSDSTLTSRINAARKALGDNGKDQRLIRTVARKGVLFVGDVRDAGAPRQEAAAIGRPAADAPVRQILHRAGRRAHRLCHRR
jgi:DNA-binding winged helix-turn-helix (wHTH) protein